MVQARTDLPLFGGEVFHGIHIFRETVNFLPVNAASSTVQTINTSAPIPVPVGWAGALAPIVICNKTTGIAGLGVANCRFLNSGQVALELINVTAAGIDPAIDTYTFAVIW